MDVVQAETGWDYPPDLQVGKIDPLISPVPTPLQIFHAIISGFVFVHRYDIWLHSA